MTKTQGKKCNNHYPVTCVGQFFFLPSDPPFMYPCLDKLVNLLLGDFHFTLFSPFLLVQLYIRISNQGLKERKYYPNMIFKCNIMNCKWSLMLLLIIKHKLLLFNFHRNEFNMSSGLFYLFFFPSILLLFIHPKMLARMDHTSNGETQQCVFTFISQSFSLQLLPIHCNFWNCYGTINSCFF